MTESSPDIEHTTAAWRGAATSSALRIVVFAFAAMVACLVHVLTGMEDDVRARLKQTVLERVNRAFTDRKPTDAALAHAVLQSLAVGELHPAMHRAFYLDVAPAEGTPDLIMAGKWLRVGQDMESAYVFVDRGPDLPAAVFALRLSWTGRFAALGNDRAFAVILVLALGIAAASFLVARRWHVDYTRPVEAMLQESVDYRFLLQFTQMAVHDIRKPFSAVKLLFARVTQSEPQDVGPLLRRHDPEVRAAISRAESLLTDIMDFSASRIMQEPVAVAPQDWLGDAFREAISAHPGGDYALAWDFRHTRKVEVDPFKMARVAANIVANALQAMPAQGRLWAKTREIEKGHASWLVVTIGNSHSHIPPDDLAKLFQPFFTKGKAKGTGLGLAIVHNIVKAHGGHIAATSDAETGTEFHITLPLRGTELCPSAHALPSHSRAWQAFPSAAQRHDAQSPPSFRATAPADEGLIVVIEDSLIVLEAWGATLADRPHRLFDRPSGFWAACEEEPGLLARVAMVVTDMHFMAGEETGIVLAARLRDEAPGAAIVLATDGAVDPHWFPAYFDGSLDKAEAEAAALFRVVEEARKSG